MPNDHDSYHHHGDYPTWVKIVIVVISLALIAGIIYGAFLANDLSHN